MHLSPGQEVSQGSLDMTQGCVLKNMINNKKWEAKKLNNEDNRREGNDKIEEIMELICFLEVEW